MREIAENVNNTLKNQNSGFIDKYFNIVHSTHNCII